MLSCFFLVFHFLDSKKQVIYSSYLTLGLGIVLSIWGIYSFLLSQHFGYLRLNSFFGYHIPFAEFLIFPMFLGLSLLWFKPFKLPARILLILVNSLFLVTFFFAYSRGAWLSFFLVSLFLVFFFRKYILKKKALVSLIIIILLSSLGMYGLRQVKNQQAAELSQQTPGVSVQANYGAETFKENALTARLLFWERALDIFKDNPLWGGGLESYKSLHLQYLQPPFYYTTDPHNFYLKVLAELGIILFFVFLGFVLSLVYYSFRVLQKIKSDLEADINTPKNNLFSLGMIGGVGSALIHNAGNFGWLYPANLIVFFVFSGIILKVYAIDRNNQSAESTKKNSFLQMQHRAWVPIFLVALFLFFSGWFILSADFYFQKGKELLIEEKQNEAIWSFQKAFAFNPFHPEYSRAAASEYFSLSRENPQNASQLLLRAEYFNKKALRWSNNSKDLVLEGEIYLAQGAYKLAEQSFLSAIEKAPASLTSYTGLVTLYRGQNRWGDIHSILEAILSTYRKEYILSPLYIKPSEEIILYRISFLHDINGVAYFHEDEFEKAETEFKKAISYSSQNASPYKNLVLIKRMEGDMHSARQYLREGLKNNPESKILLEIESLL